MVNKLLLAGDTFMQEIHLKQHRFSYSACVPFTKNKDRIQKLKEIGDTKYIYRNELDKACFQHNLAYGDFKDLARRTASDKVLRNKAFNIVKNPKYDGHQKGLASVVYKFFDKKSAGIGVTTLANNECPLDFVTQQLAEELHKSVIKKFKKRADSKMDSKIIFEVLILLIC